MVEKSVRDKRKEESFNNFMEKAKELASQKSEKNQPKKEAKSPVEAMFGQDLNALLARGKKIPKRLDRAETDAAFRNGAEPLWITARRALLIEAVRLRNIPVTEAARVLNIGRSTAYRWIKAYVEDDEDRMRDRRYGSRRKIHRMQVGGHIEINRDYANREALVLRADPPANKQGATTPDGENGNWTEEEINARIQWSLKHMSYGRRELFKNNGMLYDMLRKYVTTELALIKKGILSEDSRFGKRILKESDENRTKA